MQEQPTVSTHCERFWKMFSCVYVKIEHSVSTAVGSLSPKTQRACPIIKADCSQSVWSVVIKTFSSSEPPAVIKSRLQSCVAVKDLHTLQIVHDEIIQNRLPGSFMFPQCVKTRNLLCPHNDAFLTFGPRLLFHTYHCVKAEWEAEHDEIITSRVFTLYFVVVTTAKFLAPQVINSQHLLFNLFSTGCLIGLQTTDHIPPNTEVGMILVPCKQVSQCCEWWRCREPKAAPLPAVSHINQQV